MGYSPERLSTVYERLQQRLPKIPGVRSASFSLYSPMRGGAWSSGIAIEGRSPEPGRAFSSMWNRVSPYYFETVGTPLLRGRTIDGTDTPPPPPVPGVSRASAHGDFHGEEPPGMPF